MCVCACVWCVCVCVVCVCMCVVCVCVCTFIRLKDLLRFEKQNRTRQDGTKENQLRSEDRLQ